MGRACRKRGAIIEQLYQGDILKIDKIKHPVLVVSKDFFNTSGEIIDDTIQSIFEYI